jgi:hypothetical protein
MVMQTKFVISLLIYPFLLFTPLLPMNLYLEVVLELEAWPLLLVIPR